MFVLKPLTGNTDRLSGPPQLRSIEGSAAAYSGAGSRVAGPVASRPLPRIVDPDARPAGEWFTTPYEDLEVDFDRVHGVLWYRMHPRGRQSFTLNMLHELRHVQDEIRSFFKCFGNTGPDRIRYIVLGSRIPGTFNLGGDLEHLARLVRAGDRAGLEGYARACLDVLYPNAISFELPLITVSLVQGNALGGGFEAAISSNLVVAEESARFGLPEILFNLFPGMGAYSLLARRIGPVQAERLILGGRTWTATEMHEMGVVDVVAPDGEGEQGVYDLVARQERRFNARLGIYRARDRHADISYSELWDISLIWVDAALALEESDLRRMARLAGSQDRLRQEPASPG